MNRSTHLLMGVAAAAPIAALADVTAGASIGCLWLGAAGGALPDYLDLRSGARRSLRHRGVSHSLFAAAGITAVTWLIVSTLATAKSEFLPIAPDSVLPLTASMLAGLLSHLLGDSCTRAGVQPLLPLSSRRFWLLPRRVRGHSAGWLNGLARLASISLIGVSLAAYVQR